MKWLLISSFGLLIGCSSISHVYIVRHAEKSTIDLKDPELSEAGIRRSNDLNTLLRTKKIEKIYSTNYKRTISTVRPLSMSINVPIELYSNDSLGRMMRNIFLSNSNTVIAGHSNTVLRLLDSAGIYHSKQVIPESEYDNLFIVKVKKGKPIALKETKYGLK